jgi:hypothetical protein
MSNAAREVLAERRRQVRAEGWSEAHDDAHTDLSLAMVAALYAAPRDDLRVVGHTAEHVAFADPWPVSWARSWDKRKFHTRRKRLIIAGALILAELERMDRREGALAARPGRLAKAWRACRDWLAYCFKDDGRVPRPPANLFRKR